MATTKARSRLKKKKAPSRKAPSNLNSPNNKRRKTLVLISKKIKIKEHFQYLLIFFLAILSFYLLFLVCKNFYPKQIQNFIFNNSYLPFFILFFPGVFFLFTFIFLNQKIGLITAFFSSLLLYFKFLKLSFNFYTISSILFLTLILTITLFLNFSKNIEKDHL